MRILGVLQSVFATPQFDVIFVSVDSKDKTWYYKYNMVISYG